MKLSNINMKSYEARIEWALSLFHVLDTAAPLDVPHRPYSLRGTTDKEVNEMLKKGVGRGESEQRDVTVWLGWRKEVNHANGRNRLALRSLHRMTEIFDEKPDTAGQAETVRRFVGERWEA